MNNLNINNFKFIEFHNEYIYVFEIKDDKYILKRIKDNELIIISVCNNNNVDFKCIRNKINVNDFNMTEKENIINDILNKLQSANLLDFVNFIKLSSLIYCNSMNVCNNNSCKKLIKK